MYKYLHKNGTEQKVPDYVVKTFGGPRGYFDWQYVVRWWHEVDVPKETTESFTVEIKKAGD